MKAAIVVDLGFGDSGKGTVVDYLVRRERADLVVRYNGGAQAGHNVVTADGRHHTFSQFGAGTFVEGCRTHLAETVVVHPGALVVEEKSLRRASIFDAWQRITIAPDALVTTPFHQSLGRLRELARDEPHGTCGVGVGETMRASERLSGTDWVIRMRHLAQRDLADRVEGLRRELLAEAARIPNGSGDEEREILEDEGATRRWVDSIAPLIGRASDIVREPHEFRAVVLEGAQGILLDESWGFHPHTTWSDTTTKHARSWARRAGFSDGDVVTFGVMRTYLTRHGPGPFPSEQVGGPLGALAEAHNRDEGFQGRFRRGWPDPLLMQYAIRANGGVDCIAMTHLDALQHAHWRGVREYEGGAERLLSAPLRPDDFEARERRTAELREARVILEPVPSAEAGFVAWIEERLGARVAMGSNGPTASDKWVRT